MRMDIVLIAACFLLLLMSSADIRAVEKIEITRNGEPKAVIILGKNPTLAAAFAAQELRDHIKLITGAELRIVSEDYETEETKLYVGESWPVAKLGISAYRFKEQEYAIKFFDNAVVFIGKDENISAPKEGALPLPDFYEEKGTMTAVYDFLYNYCDIRWYVPGEIGTCYNKKPTLVVKGTDVQRQPDMKYVWLYNTELWMPTGSDNVPRPIANLWKLRVGMGGQPFNVNHSFYGFYNRYLNTHPDWFAQGYNNPDGRPPQMCFTNPEFIAQVVQDARDYFDGKGLKEGAVGMGDVFGLVPMDNTDYCKCERCQAEFNPAEKDNPEFSGGYASSYIWGFINKVAKEVKKTHPDKYVGALAYWDYAKYPTDIKLESNIAVMMCLDTREWYRPASQKAEMAIYNSWITKEKDRPIYLWLYFCFPALAGKVNKFNVFPGYYANYAIKHSEMFSKGNIKGVFMEHSSEANMTHLLDLPEVYLTTVMGRDSRINGKAALNEFFKRFYGSAAAPMQKLYNALEEIYWNPENYAGKKVWGGQNEEIAWGYLGTPERMTKFEMLMEQAKASAKTDLEKARVALFESGVWEYMKDGARNHLENEKIRQQPLSKISVPKQPVEIAEGDTAKVDWSKAAALSGWKLVTGQATNRKLETKLTHDGKYLYIELEELLDPKTLVSVKEIWYSDDWEIFFAAKREKPYRQLAVNPAGAHVEYHWDDGGTEWDAGAIYTSDTSLPDRWRVRISLPLEKLLPGGVRPGTPFYANFYRTVAGQVEHLAWNPNFVKNFQELSRLGEFTLE